MSKATPVSYERVVVKPLRHDKVKKTNNVLLWREKILFASLAFLLTRAVLLGALAPFGLAFFSAVMSQRKENGLVVLGTSLFSLLIFNSLAEAIISFLPFITLYLLGCLYQGKDGGKYFYPGFALVGMVIAKSLPFLWHGFHAYILVTILFDGILMFFMAVVFHLAVSLMVEPDRLSNLSKEDIICGVLLAVGIIAGTSGIKLGPVSVQTVLSRYIVLVWGLAGMDFGAAVGVIVGVIALFTNQMELNMVAMYAFSGLLAGLGRDLGKFGVVSGFFMGNVFLFLYMTQAVQPGVFFMETGLACVLFLATPSSFVGFISNINHRSSSNEELTFSQQLNVREMTAQRISEMSMVFGQLARTFEQISSGQEEVENNPVTKLVDSLANRVCSSCSSVKLCWEKEFYHTYQLMFDLIAKGEGSQGVTLEQIPIHFKKRCSRSAQIVHTMNWLLEMYAVDRYWGNKITESKAIVSGQLKGVAQIMDRLAEEIQVDMGTQGNLKHKITKVLSEQHIDCDHIHVVKLDQERFDIEINRPSCLGRGECRKRIGPLVSHALGQPLHVQATRCSLKTGEEICSFKLFPSRPYRVQVGVAKTAKDNHQISGDNCSALELRDGKQVIALSDGMGSGPKAAMQSNTAVSLLEQFMEVGFSHQLAVQTVNSVLVLRSTEESFATLDLMIVDLYSGQMELTKIGSASSFIKRGRQVDIVSLNSLPIGILNNIEIRSVNEQLGDEDMVVLISDGVLDARKDLTNKEEWVAQMLQRINSDDPQYIADYILERATRHYGGRIEDDMTVVVAKVNRDVGYSLYH